MKFAKVVRKLQVTYWRASQADMHDATLARELREQASALADAHGIPDGITTGLQEMIAETGGKYPALYRPPTARRA